MQTKNFFSKNALIESAWTTLSNTGMKLLAVIAITLITMQAQAVDVNTYSALQTQAAATTGDNQIRLTGNITNGASQLTVNRSLTLDLNGYNLTITLGTAAGASDNCIKIGNGVTLTITDSQAGTNSLSVTHSGIGDVGCGAGINATHGSLIIQSGRVTANGGTYGAGIGGGNGGSGGNITINGGTVIANGGQGAAGIGGGFSGNSGTIVINGGAVTATGGVYSGAGGSGIGSGYGLAGRMNVNSITIFGELISGAATPVSGQVKAVGGSGSMNGANIGQGGYIHLLFTATHGSGITSVVSPADRTVNEGQTAMFSVTVTKAQSPTVSYQWQISTNGGSSWSDIASATATNFTTSATTTTMDNNRYRCRVTASGLGGTPGTITLYGKPAMLTVKRLSLQERVNMASGGTASSPVTISLDGGTETLTSTLQIADISSGNASRHIRLINGTVKRGNAFTGNGTNMVNIPTGSTLVLDNMILDGSTTGGSVSGTIINITGGSVMLNNQVTVRNNKASGAGGGVWMNGGTFGMGANTSIEGNSANGQGGGVFVGGTNTQCNLYGGTISGNTSTSNGGGVYVSGTNAECLLFGATISGNTASGSGGGVCLTGSSNTFHLRDGDITGNHAGNGGGVNLDDGIFNLSGGRITGNTVTTSARGFLYWGGTLNIFGKPVVGTTTDNNGIRRRYNTMVASITGALTSGASVNLESLPTDAANTIVATKTSGTLTATEVSYFHYLNTNFNLLLHSDNRSLILQQILTSIAFNIPAPVIGATPITTISTGSAGYEGAVEWNPAHIPFQGGTTYAATATLTAKSGYVFASTLTTATVNGQVTTITSKTGTTVSLSPYSFTATGTKTVTGIAITSEPAKMIYTHGEALDLTGLAVLITYNNNPSDTEPVNFTDFETKGISTNLSDGSTLSVSQNGVPVTVSYGNTFVNTNPLKVNPIPITAVDVNVIAPMTGQALETITNSAGHFTVTSVVWNPVDDPYLGNTAYNVAIGLSAETGYTFDASLTANINNEPASVSGAPGLSATLSYTFPPTNAATVTAIAIKTQPVTLSYVHGQALDLSGLEVTLSYDDGTTKDVGQSTFWSYGIATNPTNGSILNELQHGLPVSITCGRNTVNTNPLSVSVALAAYDVNVIGSFATAGTTGTGSYLQGATVIIDAGSRPGYHFAGWITTSPGVTFANPAASSTNFIMPSSAVTVTAIWTLDPVYTINIKVFSGRGSVSADKSVALAGETVTLTIMPDDDYEFESILIIGSDAHPGASTSSVIRYTFIMPASNVTVTVAFRKATREDAWETPKKMIEAATFILTQKEAPDENTTRFALATLINELIKSTGFIISPYDIVIFHFVPAMANNQPRSVESDNEGGKENGFFEFRVSPPDTRSSAYNNGIITASTDSTTGNDSLVTGRDARPCVSTWNQNGMLHVTGLTPGKHWQVYTLSGTRIYNGIASNEKAEIQLPVKGIYLIVHDNKTLKTVVP